MISPIGLTFVPISTDIAYKRQGTIHTDNFICRQRKNIISLTEGFPNFTSSESAELYNELISSLGEYQIRKVNTVHPEQIHIPNKEPSS